MTAGGHCWTSRLSQSNLLQSQPCKSPGEHLLEHGKLGFRECGHARLKHRPAGDVRLQQQQRCLTAHRVRNGHGLHIMPAKRAAAKQTRASQVDLEGDKIEASLPNYHGDHELTVSLIFQK
eukprot:1157776-Pelagomonas_calceolata.AAC.4